MQKLQPQLPEAERQATLGRLYLQQKAYPEAQQALEQALLLQPDDKPLLLALAQVMEQQRLFEKAVYYYQKATGNR